MGCFAIFPSGLGAARPCRKLIEQPREIRARLRNRPARRPAAQLHHDVGPVQAMLHGAKYLPHQALGAIAVDRAWGHALAGNDSDTRMG